MQAAGFQLTSSSAFTHIRNARLIHSEEKAHPAIIRGVRYPLADRRGCPCTARVDGVLPGSVVRDTGHSAPAEFHFADRDESRSRVVELARAPDAVDLVTVALSDVNVRSVCLHPRPPSFLQGVPRFFVGVERKLPTSRPEQDAVGVVVPGKREKHTALRADEVHLPVCRAEAVERDHDVLMRFSPVNGKLDAPMPDPPGQFEHPLRFAEATS